VLSLVVGLTVARNGWLDPPPQFSVSTCSTRRGA
jgi:hypothetical protein